ncbi:hypothetical protein LIER_13209 [Lithospermum erythrorhizon]|uniref:Reverse transcriptase domain-containing protein n=1 Tax=Lithospermum erythrorhizon TaxID=34254 RepID=A0AAV3PYS4_LITER
MQYSAYVPGRKIVDRVMLMQELVNGYTRAAGKPRCAIKIDIMKAYDTVRWEFLWKVLELLKFPFIFINWIKGSITSVWFSVSLNGGLHEFFHRTRGLRQGDPLSPYLFIIVMDMFNVVLMRKIEAKEFDYHPKCQEVKLPNIGFANDLFVMTGATRKSFTVLKEALYEFEKMFGLQPNMQKSTCYFAGTTSKEARELEKEEE